MKIRSLLFCAAILATGATACSKDDPADKLDESASNVGEHRDDLAEQREDLAKASTEGNAGDQLEQRADIAHASADLANAQMDFETRRDQYVSQLRMRHQIFENQAAVARGLLATPNISENARQAATDRVLTFERELRDSQAAIDAVATSTASQWDSVHTTVDNELSQLRGAHDDAFDALTGDADGNDNDDVRYGTTRTTTTTGAADVDVDTDVDDDARAGANRVKSGANDAWQDTKATTKDAWDKTKSTTKDAYDTTKAKTKGAYNDAVDNGKPGDDD